MNDTYNKSVIAGHEGMRLTAYRDTRGKLTIGRGFNLDQAAADHICTSVGLSYEAVCAGAPITEQEAESIFDQQYAIVAGQARITFSGIDSFPEGAAAVICDMIFELGWDGFLGFHDTVVAFKARNWAGAIAGIRDSLLASQVPGRVESNILLLRAIPSASQEVSA